MLTVAIIGIVSGILTTGLVAARKQAAVRNAAHELASHLREASVSTQNGLEKALCRVSKPAGLTDEQKAAWDSRCVRYAITFQPAMYTIITWNNPTFQSGDQTFTPPADVLMATNPAGVVVAFKYDPPLIKAGMVTPTTVGSVTYYDNFAESDVEIKVSHAVNPEYMASVCVSGNGAVTVSGSSCEF